MCGQIQGFSHLRIGGVEHGSFNGAHGGRTRAHIENSRCAAPYHRRSRCSKLMDHDPADSFGGMLHHRAEQGHRGGCTRQRHGDNLGRNACSRQVDQVLRTEIAPNQGRRGADIKHSSRFSCRGSLAAAKERQQLQHRLQPCRRKRPCNNRFCRRTQHQVQAVDITNSLWRIVTDHRRRLGVEFLQHFGDLDNAQQVSRGGRLVLKGIRIQHMHTRRAGVELHRIAAVLHHRVAVQVVQVEAFGRALQRPASQAFGNRDDLALKIHPGAGLRQELQGSRGLYHDPWLLHQLKGLCQDLLD